MPDRLLRTPDVLVVGGGILGVATAVSCQRAGLGTVALVERSTLGAGATCGAAGLLIPDAPHSGDPAGVVDRGRLSLAGWRELDDLVPDGVGLTEMDWLQLDPQPGADTAHTGRRCSPPRRSADWSRRWPVRPPAS